MIGRMQEKRGYWIQALVLSLAVHGVAAAAVMDVLPSLPRRDDSRALPEIDILSLPVEQGSAAQVVLDQAQPVTGAASVSATLPPAQVPMPDQTSKAEQPVLTPSDDMIAATTATPVEPVEPVTAPNTPPVDGSDPVNVPGSPEGDGQGVSPGSPQQNAAISDLVLRLRERLAQPCLAALPQTIGGDEVLLTTLGAVDRDISDLFRDIAGTVEVPMTERSVLLDARQCPAVDFVRASASYPALPLVLRLEASEVASDGQLIGEITGAGGNPVALLIIDDNGVVQDLGRFTLASGEVTRFDIPVYRVGGNRDTSQLLMAVALPQRPESIAGLSGRLASDFFPPLAEAAAGRALIGVAPVYVRAVP
ncbi:hypothetical protein [uncultured Paracoccus sp.]|uniref:hypothetical protein n=1 Tax=uncultured Paracoccus sp. TaxID=189685 RepID=UPI00261FA087|nr:hypothetical protein [uncultured Paracoccus sp.]